MKGIAYTIAAVIVGLLVHPASAQVTGEMKGLEGFKGKRGPVNITSQRVEAEYEKRLITYIGDVVAKHEDFTLYADRILLFLSDETKGIEKIVAKGNVRITEKERIVTGEQAVFHSDEQRIVVTGNPVMREGNNVISGDRVVVLLDENRGVVEGTTGKRVTATIYPDESKGKKKKE
jgi:lipopolysaccharide export system protein LptA